jgi:tryptophanyl-tRNA synthetase
MKPLVPGGFTVFRGRSAGLTTENRMPSRSPAATAPPRELSGITPSGTLTLGNHLGALRRFRDHQDSGFYFVANLHALTTPHSPERLRRLTLSTAALFFASGLERATVFLQSDVPAHVELAYLLESTAYVGELGRMIQFKEKGGRPGTRASLFTYPCLMAADILLYDAAQVPVGNDQSQHVELTRDLAHRFNTAYGPTFTVPELVPAALTARVRDLADPARKMSKSAPEDAPGVIRMLDTADVIRRKVRRAVTDSDGELRYDPDGKPGLANLAEIAAALAGETPEQVLAKSRGYGELKDTCADLIDAELAPIRARHDELLDDEDELRRLLADGARRAGSVAQPVLDRARHAIGVVGSAARDGGFAEARA